MVLMNELILLKGLVDVDLVVIVGSRIIIEIYLLFHGLLIMLLNKLDLTKL